MRWICLCCLVWSLVGCMGASFSRKVSVSQHQVGSDASIKAYVGQLERKRRKIEGKTAKESFQMAKRHVLRCYRMRLKKVPGLKGKVSFQIVVHEGVTVKLSIFKEKTTLQDKAILYCIRRIYKMTTYRQTIRSFNIESELRFRP